MTAGKPDTAESNSGFPDYYDLLYLPEGKIMVTERDLGILMQEARMDKDEDLTEYISKHRAQTRQWQYQRVHLLITTEFYRVYRMGDKLHQPNLSRAPSNGITPRSTMQMVALLEQLSVAKTNENRAKWNRQRQNRRERNQTQHKIQEKAVGLVPQSLGSKGTQKSIKQTTRGGHFSPPKCPTSQSQHHARISTPYPKALPQQSLDCGTEQPAYGNNYKTMKAVTQKCHGNTPEPTKTVV
jgi:hypothetical protein